MIRVIKLFISLLFWVGCRLEESVKRTLNKNLPGTCIFLYYHAISPHQREIFAKQMDHLLRWARPISVGFNGPLEPQVHYVGITFDDGFTCVMENALPELMKRQIPATIFVPTGYLGRPPEWVNDPNYKERNEMVMTSEQLRGLPSDLISIGSHSVTHRRLPFLTEKEAMRELHESRKELKFLLGREIKYFAFPYGSYNTDTVELARQVGYERIFSNLPTLAHVEQGEVVTGRVWINPTDSPLELRLKVQGAYRWLPYAFALKHKLHHLLKVDNNHPPGWKHKEI